MPYSLIADMPNLSKKAKFEIDGLGIFTNNEEYVVSDEEAKAYVIRQSSLFGEDEKTFIQHFSADKNIKVKKIKDSGAGNSVPDPSQSRIDLIDEGLSGTSGEPNVTTVDSALSS